MSKSDMLISVIIPAYNAEPYIEKCISSILCQSYKNIEVVVVDDGSSDNTLALAKKMAEADKRVKVFAKENGGVSSARNYGISVANGELINFVDSDDTIPPDAFEKLYRSLGDDVDLVCGLYIELRLKEKLVERPAMRIRPDEKFTRFAEYKSELGGPCGKLYKKEIIDKFNITFDESVCFGEDHIFNLEYAKRVTGDIVVISEPVYIYNNRLRSNLCSRTYSDMARIKKAAMEAELHYFDGEEIDEALKNSLISDALYASLEHYLVFFKKDVAAKLIEEAFDVFGDYITESVLSAVFSPEQIKLIESKDFSAFCKLMLSGNLHIHKRIIANKLKKLLASIL